MFASPLEDFQEFIQERLSLKFIKTKVLSCWTGNILLSYRYELQQRRQFVIFCRLLVPHRTKHTGRLIIHSAFYGVFDLGELASFLWVAGVKVLRQGGHLSLWKFDLMLIFIYYSGQSIYVSLGDRSLEWSRVGLDLRAVPLKALCLGGHSCQNGSNPPKSARKRQSWTKVKVEMKFYALHVFDWEAVRMCWSLSNKGTCERLNSVSRRPLYSYLYAHQMQITAPMSWSVRPRKSDFDLDRFYIRKKR